MRGNCSACSSAFIGRRSSRATGSDSRPYSGSFIGMAGGCGRRVRSVTAPRSTWPSSACLELAMPNRPILLVEDSENDIELTIESLARHVVNEVDVARDGAEALDYLFRRGSSVGRVTAPPVLVMLDRQLPKVDGREVARSIKAEPTPTLRTARVLTP